MRIVARAVVVVALAGAAIAGCGEDRVDRSGTINLMVAEGLSRAQAECVLDAAIDAFGEARLVEMERNDGMSPEEEALLEQIVIGCEVTPDEGG